MPGTFGRGIPRGMEEAVFGKDGPLSSWEPKEHEKRYYRHRSTGDRAYLVRRDGNDCLRLDRPHQEMIRKLDDNWQPDDDHRPVTRAALGRIAFEADRHLCQALGLHENARKEWATLSQEQKLAWMNDGPTTQPRRGLWEALTDYLRPMSE